MGPKSNLPISSPHCIPIVLLSIKWSGTVQRVSICKITTHRITPFLSILRMINSRNLNCLKREQLSCQIRLLHQQHSNSNHHHLLLLRPILSLTNCPRGRKLRNCWAKKRLFWNPNLAINNTWRSRFSKLRLSTYPSFTYPAQQMKLYQSMSEEETKSWFTSTAMLKTLAWHLTWCTWQVAN